MRSGSFLKARRNRGVVRDFTAPSGQDPPLGRHVLNSVLSLDMGRPAIIVGDPAPNFARDAADAGLAELILNSRADKGLASSVACAAQWAADAGSEALLLLLADMPLVGAFAQRARQRRDQRDRDLAGIVRAEHLVRRDRAGGRAGRARDPPGIPAGQASLTS